MLRKIKNFFIKLFCLIWISAIWSIAATSYDLGGAEINGFFAFFLWIVSLLVLWKVSAVASALGSSVLILVLRVTRFGFHDVVLYGLGITAALFGGLILFSKLMWGEIGRGRNSSQRNMPKREEKRQKPQKSEHQGWDHWDNEKEYNPRETEPEKDEEFYNIKDRDSSAVCPYIYHQSSEGGKKPYYCSVGQCGISSDKYYHLCAYRWEAEEKCHYRKMAGLDWEKK